MGNNNSIIMQRLAARLGGSMGGCVCLMLTRRSNPKHLSRAPLVRAFTPPSVGADTSRSGTTSPFHDAVERGDLEEIRPWLTTCAKSGRIAIDVNMPDKGRAGATAMHIASRRGLVDVMRELYSNGAKLDATGPWGMTPLQYGTVFGHRASVQLLLELGADPTIIDQAGRTALDHAVAEQQTEIAADLARWFQAQE